MINHLAIFRDHLLEALPRIESKYNSINVAGQKALVLRERIFCYELYHQLRSSLSEIRFPYMMCGELDKRGHPIIRGGPIPDFVIHEPGHMDRNLAIIEVKRVSATLKSLNEDISKLIEFINLYKYFSGFLLVFGEGEERDERKLIKLITQRNRDISKKNVFVIWSNPKATLSKEILRANGFFLQGMSERQARSNSEHRQKT